MSELSKLLKAARERAGSVDLVGYVYVYCDNRDCTAREFSVLVKWHWDETIPKAIHCPLCGEAPIVNAVQTLQEHEQKNDWDARCRVNVQRYQKRTGNIAIPGHVYFDDSLPD